MTLTVRLDPSLSTALERYCVDTGCTKSHVVQESLAAYLLDSARLSAAGAVRGAGSNGARVSDSYQAFADAGLVGAVALSLPGGQGAQSADKSAVRAQVASRTSARRRGAAG